MESSRTASWYLITPIFFFLMEVGSSWDKSPGLERAGTGGGGFKFPLLPSLAGLASSAGGDTPLVPGE